MISGNILFTRRKFTSSPMCPVPWVPCVSRLPPGERCLFNGTGTGTHTVCRHRESSIYNYILLGSRFSVCAVWLAQMGSARAAVALALPDFERNGLRCA